MLFICNEYLTNIVLVCKIRIQYIFILTKYLLYIQSLVLNKYNYFTRFKRVNVKFDKLRPSLDSDLCGKLFVFGASTLISTSCLSPRPLQITPHGVFAATNPSSQHNQHGATSSMAPITFSPSRGYHHSHALWFVKCKTKHAGMGNDVPQDTFGQWGVAGTQEKACAAGDLWGESENSTTWTFTDLISPGYRLSSHLNQNPHDIIGTAALATPSSCNSNLSWISRQIRGHGKAGLEVAVGVLRMRRSPYKFPHSVNQPHVNTPAYNTILLHKFTLETELRMEWKEILSADVIWLKAPWAKRPLNRVQGYASSWISTLNQAGWHHGALNPLKLNSI